MKDPLKFSGQPRLESSSLIVGWNVDAGRLGAKVTDYLNKKLGGQSFAEIEPVEFFPLGGVAIDDDLVQFPESRFFACPDKNLVILKSDPPGYDWYKFLNLVLDVADHCHAREIHAVGGMVALGAHTAPRLLTGTFNSPELKTQFSGYDLSNDLDYETPAGQRPTINSFLSWAAARRDIPAVNLWVPVPFYLVALEDPRAEKRVLEFFNQRFNLGLDFSEVDEEVKMQNERLAKVRETSPLIDGYIKRLESNLSLSEEESQRLIKEVDFLLKEKEG